MESCDTNILVYAYHQTCEEHGKALSYLQSKLKDPDFALSELILVEFYVLLRNPTVFPKPLSASDAREIIQELRGNPFWTIVKGTTDVSDFIWSIAGEAQFPRRAIFDARIAFSLVAEGVTRFATRNRSHFERFDVFETFDPLI